MHLIRRNESLAFAALLLLVSLVLMTTSVEAQQVLSGISTQEAYVGSEVILQIQVRNAESHQPPQIPDVAGIQISSAGTPSRSSNLTIINGRRSSASTVTYSYVLTPQREGTVTIPAIEVEVNGATMTTKPHTLVVTTSETGDLLFVEITSGADQAYVGQAVKLKLKVWVRPYADRGFEYRFSEADMWQLFSRQTNWGVFHERLDEMSQANRRPAGQEVLRKDDEGVSRAYLLYEIESTTYPKRPGQIDPGDVRIVVNYPTKLARSRSRFLGDDFFGPSLLDQLSNRRSVTVEASRPISAEATAPPIRILDVPAQGRPANYRGAVGKYQLIVQAEPKNVKVGEPIALRIVVQGDGPMELVEAPPLASLSDLNRDFKVDDESLAGFVQDDAKLFTTSIRPRREDVFEIPPIPFSFFDPKSESFRTVLSQRIPIVVEATESLSLDSIVANRSPARADAPKRSNQSNSAQPSGIELFDVREMLKDSPTRPATPRSHSWLPFAIAPTCCLVGFLLFKRAAITELFRFERDPVAAAKCAIRQATTASQVRDALELKGVPASDAIRAIQRDCDQATFCPTSQCSLHDLKRNAEAALRHLLPILTCLLTTALMASQTWAEQRNGPQLHLTEQQIEILLAEALTAQQEALLLKNTDPASAQARLDKAITKYELISESNFRSAALLRNLGDAYRENGEMGRASVAYEKANRLFPWDTETAQRIRQVQKSLGSSPDDNLTDSLVDLLRVAPQSLLRILAVVLWSLACGMLTTMALLPTMRRAVSIALTSSLLLAAGICLSLPVITEPSFDAVAVEDEVEVRSADGESFPIVAVLRSGDPVRIHDRRGSWLLVESTDSRTGWIPSKQVESLQ